MYFYVYLYKGDVVESVLSKLCRYIGEILFTLELASLNKLSECLLPCRKLTFILQRFN